MKVEVQPIYERGKALRTKDRATMPKYRGTLRVREERVSDWARAVTTAALVSDLDGVEAPVLPALLDANVLFIQGAQLRISGFELVEGAQYGQTWDVKVREC
ncbi:MAG: hypothetical protein JOY60_10935 [Burkholderiaceae bacterium]|nr:hypothetical protein [Burkholderiaceae bacterium]